MTEYSTTACNTSAGDGTNPPDQNEGLSPPDGGELDNFEGETDQSSRLNSVHSGHRVKRMTRWYGPDCRGVEGTVYVPKSISSPRTVKCTRDKVLGEIIRTSGHISKQKSETSANTEGSELSSMGTYRDHLMESLYGETVRHGQDHGLKFIEEVSRDHEKLYGKLDAESTIGDFEIFRNPLNTLYGIHFRKVLDLLRYREERAGTSVSTKDIRERRKTYDDCWLLLTKAECEVNDTSVIFTVQADDPRDPDGPRVESRFTWNGHGFTYE